MPTRAALRAAVAAMLGAALLWACSPASSARGTDLTIFAAASLREVLEAVEPAYEEATNATTLTIATDSSAALATQIEQGAPADVFLSADTANPQALVDGGFLSGDLVVFAANALTIIVPAGNPAGITSPLDLAAHGVDVVTASDEVPITGYATQLVLNLAGEPGYPPDFAAAYARNVVSKEANVKAIVAKIELGEADAGIVYRTDAVASDGVTAIDVPASANVRASYAGVVVGASGRQDEARAFLEWLVDSDGQAILASFDFLPPGP